MPESIGKALWDDYRIYSTMSPVNLMQYTKVVTLVVGFNASGKPFGMIIGSGIRNESGFTKFFRLVVG